MSSNEKGEGSLIAHPLFDHSALLRTLPSEELFRDVKRALILRDIGRVYTGPPRIGKTDALDRVKLMLQQTYPKLSIYSHDAHNSQMPSIRAFFKHFLSTVGHQNKKGETFDLRERVVGSFASEARLSGMNLVVLFIDEGSALLHEDFLFLKDIYNDLNRQGIQLFTVMMGQSPDMQNVIHDLYAESRDDLVGRFAQRVKNFRAFDSLDDIIVIFEGIDTREFPIGSGKNWVSFFIPEAVKAGFLLRSQAEIFFAAISSFADKKAIFPASATFLAIRIFLLDAAGYDAPNMILPEDIWLNAVQEAQLDEAMERIQQGAKSGKKKS